MSVRGQSRRMAQYDQSDDGVSLFSLPLLSLVSPPALPPLSTSLPLPIPASHLGQFLQKVARRQRAMRVLRVTVIIPFNRITLPHACHRQLVTQRRPPRPHVMGAAEDLALAALGGDPFDESIDLIRLAARLTHLRHEDIRVEVPLQLRVALDPDQAMLLAVVDPVARPARPNDALTEKKRKRKKEEGRRKESMHKPILV